MAWKLIFPELKVELPGLPLIPLLFILSAEILANEIIENTNMKGIQTNCKEIKITRMQMT